MPVNVEREACRMMPKRFLQELVIIIAVFEDERRRRVTEVMYTQIRGKPRFFQYELVRFINCIAVEAAANVISEYKPGVSPKRPGQ